MSPGGKQSQVDDEGRLGWGGGGGGGGIPGTGPADFPGNPTAVGNKQVEHATE